MLSASYSSPCHERKAPYIRPGWMNCPGLPSVRFRNASMATIRVPRMVESWRASSGPSSLGNLFRVLPRGQWIHHAPHVGVSMLVERKQVRV